jgi:hypothetical protein
MTIARRVRRRAYCSGGRLSDALDCLRGMRPDADCLKQDSLMRYSVGPTAPAARSPWYPSETHLRSSFEERAIRPEFALAVPHLIASIMSDPKWPS